jgi:hypothetical protein
MIKILSYPTCSKSFKFICDNLQLTNKKYKLDKVSPFDVTLRDGLQGLTKEQQLTMNPNDLTKLYFEIKEKYQPKNMEIGSIVSSNSKILPIFKNSNCFYNYIEHCQTPDICKNTNNFILIPNEEQFQNIYKFIGLDCFSFITSVSESFQMKNTKMTLDTTYKQIHNMMCILDDKPGKNIVKLYVSCINECPIEGQIDTMEIINKIKKYQELKPDILCLSDTCGTLSEEVLYRILSSLNLGSDNGPIGPSMPQKPSPSHSEGLKRESYNNISLHLHVKPGRENEVEKMIHTALDYGITSFDVSALKSGGCSVTMNQNDLCPNLSYELYYKSLTTYLLK